MRWTAFRRERNEEQQQKERRKKHFQFLNALTLQMNTFVPSRLSFDSRYFFFSLLFSLSLSLLSKSKQYSTRFHEIPHSTAHRTQQKIFTLHVDRTTRARTIQVQRFNAYANEAFE